MQAIRKMALHIKRFMRKRLLFQKFIATTSRKIFVVVSRAHRGKKKQLICCQTKEKGNYKGPKTG